MIINWRDSETRHKGNIGDAVIVKSVYRESLDSEPLNQYPLGDKTYQSLTRIIGHEPDRAEATITKFNYPETDIKISPSIRKGDVYLLHDFHENPDGGMAALLLTIDALKRGSASSITVVAPFMPYERGDWKPSSRKSIPARLWPKLLETAGMTRMIRIDLHADQISGFYDCPIDALQTTGLFGDYIYDKIGGNIVIGTCDSGGDKRSDRMHRFLERRFNTAIPRAYIDKGRPQPGVSVIKGITGDVSGKDVVVIEDVADTCGTFANASQTYIERGGAKHVYGFETVGLFSHDKKKNESAEQKMQRTNDTSMWITDARYVPPQFFERNKGWLKGELSTAELFAQAIYRNQTGESVSDLFEI
ncbi:MAG: ribose-phosphate diphosphokinase [Candidatus Aenigmarchaeota archaeon]|nr:ribose-phosphate diphosphokinase [Candidatus Aenigmarchaeota archaeon]